MLQSFKSFNRIFKHTLSINRFLSSSVQHDHKEDQESQLLFECPRKEFHKCIVSYNFQKERKNYAMGFVYKDRIWGLYDKLSKDYKFTENELRAVLQLLQFSSVEEDLKLERIQHIIDKMISLGYNPGGDGLMALISAHSTRANAIDKIEGLLYSWKHSPPQTKRVYNTLLRVYARLHGTEVAEKWFDSLIGTMIYTETGVKRQSLRPLIKDGGVYSQLVRMYCDEGNLELGIKRFNEMSKKFDQSNRNGSLGRIMYLLLKEGMNYEVLAWYTTSKLWFMWFDETGYLKVFRAVLNYAFSRNIFISAKDIINILGEYGTEWKLKENELDSTLSVDNSELKSLISSLDVNQSITHKPNTSAWYYTPDNCLNREDSENEVEKEGENKAPEMELNESQTYVNEIKDLLKNYKFGEKYVVNHQAMPLEYDEEFLNSHPHEMIKVVFSDMFKKTPPSLLTFNAIIYAYFKVGAYEQCAIMFEYMKRRLDVYFDSLTITIMTKIYARLGEHGKSIAIGRLNDNEILDGNLVMVGAQMDTMLSIGRHQELEEMFKSVDDNREMGSRNLTVGLRLYIKENKMDDAKRIFERIVTAQIEEGAFCPIPFNIMLQKYSNMEDIYSFRDLLDRMTKLGMSLSEDSYVVIMKAYVQWNDSETALEYYRKMINAGIEPTLFSYHCILDIFAKMNNQNGIIDTIRTMITRGVVPNEYTLQYIIGYYIHRGKINEARQIQDLFHNSFPHIASNIRCHNMIIKYYTKLEDYAGVLEEVHRATSIYNARPDIYFYTCMIKAFAVKDIKTARKIFDLALEKCPHSLNVDIFSFMMEAYYDGGDYESIRSIYTKMCALETFDFTGFPPANVPPPVNPAWNNHYGISAGITPGVKTPLNSVTYPQCPTSRDSCDFSCYQCARPDDITICPESKEFGMTFDDGPSNNSLLVLDALKQLNVKGTFCVLGSQILLYPQVLKRMYAEGHTICAHTWSHKYLTSQTDEQIVAEFEFTLQAIQLVIGVRPTLARAPFGDIDDRVREVFRKMKLTNLLWNKDTFDWKLNNPLAYNFSESYVTGNVSNWIQSGQTDAQGSIILTHDVLPNSAKLAVESLYMVKNASLRILSIEQCLASKVYEKPTVPPNTTTGTDFPVPDRQVKGNTASKVFVGSPTWFLVLSSIFKLLI